MSDRMRHRAHLSLYLAGEQPCSYLPDHRSRSLFVDPFAALNGQRYQSLLAQGFRRSGRFVYRPACQGCRQCVALRLPANDFSPNRSQRRAQQGNQDLSVHFVGAGFSAEHFALYRTYLETRHFDGEMADSDEEGYRHFLIDPWGGQTELMELRLGGRLIGLAVTDLLPDALSAAYTFFDPAFGERSLGTFAILRQIDEAQRRGLSHLYLGFWIEACRKMRYKDRFRPLEAWDGHRWQRLGRDEPILPRPPLGGD